MMNVVLLIAATIVVYLNSFTTPFLFDDLDAILRNPLIHDLWPPWKFLGASPRPLVDLSFALNYAFGGLNPWGYHLVNLAIHLSAGLVLFGLLRRTLALRLRSERSERSPERAERVEGVRRDGLAFAIALLWLVHPLQTESVTYIVQRAESLMGLCYLGTLYSLARAAASTHPRRWVMGAVLLCACGMLSKPVMVSAPLLALLYDRTFGAGGVRSALRQRPGFYAGLAGSWLLLTLVLSTAPLAPEETTGLRLSTVSQLEYLQTQPGIILHYLRLALWPHPLILDYNWLVARGIEAILLPALGVGALLILTLWALRRHPALGFCGAWIFGILAPSSSLLPIADLAFEHRIYLPLAGVLALVLVAGVRTLDALIGSRRRAYASVAVGLVTIWAVSLGGLTVRRNADYRSEFGMWRDIVSKRPTNPRAHVNLGLQLIHREDLQGAKVHLEEALRLDPALATAHDGLGLLLAWEGRLDEAKERFREALRLQPASSKTHNNLGLVLFQEGKLGEAKTHFSEALRLQPDLVEAKINLDRAIAQERR